MRRPHSAPNYDDPVEWLAPPDYYAPLRTGDHIIPIAANASIVALTVEVGPNGRLIVVTIISGGA